MVKVLFVDITDYQYDATDFRGICEARVEYLNSINDQKRKTQSLLVWRLLNYGLINYFSLNNGCFSCDKGKWAEINGKIKFSLAHSNNIIAVAISNKTPVGVDVEMHSDKILKLKDKLCKQKEAEEELIETLTLTWTEKESSFKAGIKGSFNWISVKDKINNKYCLTLCSQEKDVNFIKIKLKDIID